MRLEINKLKSENEELKSTLRKTQLSFSSIKSKAVHVLFFTGLTNVIFEWLIRKLKDSVEVVRVSMNLEDHLLAILMKLMALFHCMVRHGTVRFTFGGFSTGYCTWYLILF